jgi:transposase
MVRQLPGAAIGMKIAALLLIQEGQRPGWTAEALGMTRQSLNLWLRKVNEQGPQALQPVKRPGRPARLTPKVRQELEDHLERSPSEFGLNRAWWDGPTLVVHLKRRFAITLKVRQAQSWMHQLGYRLKQGRHSHLHAKSRDAPRSRRASRKTAVPEREGNDRIW